MYFVHSFPSFVLVFLRHDIAVVLSSSAKEADGKELCDLLVKLFRVAIEGLHSAKTAVIEQE